MYQFLGTHVHTEYLHWALKSTTITYIGLVGSLGDIITSNGESNGKEHGKYIENSCRV